MTNITIVNFDLPLKQTEVQKFRGGLLALFGASADPLMHNHTIDGLRFSYPLIQYKSIDGHAAIIGIGEGSSVLRNLFKLDIPFEIKLGKKTCKAHLTSMKTIEYEPIIEDEPKIYHITDYLPLTDENVKEYDSYLALTDKICLLEKILVANILSFFKGISYHSEEKIECVVSSIDHLGFFKYKGVNFRAFDMHFVSNVVLPNYIGLGKSTSIGMGTIIKEQLPEKFNSYIK